MFIWDEYPEYFRDVDRRLYLEHMHEPPRGLLVECTSCGLRYRYDGGPCAICRGSELRGLEPPPPRALIDQIAQSLVEPPRVAVTTPADFSFFRRIE